MWIYPDASLKSVIFFYFLATFCARIYLQHPWPFATLVQAKCIAPYQNQLGLFCKYCCHWKSKLVLRTKMCLKFTQNATCNHLSMFHDLIDSMHIAYFLHPSLFSTTTTQTQQRYFLSHCALHRLLLLHLHQRERDHEQLCGGFLWHEENCLWCHLQEPGHLWHHHRPSISISISITSRSQVILDIIIGLLFITDIKLLIVVRHLNLTVATCRNATRLSAEYLSLLWARSTLFLRWQNSRKTIIAVFSFRFHSRRTPSVNMKRKEWQTIISATQW